MYNIEYHIYFHPSIHLSIHPWSLRQVTQITSYYAKTAFTSCSIKWDTIRKYLQTYHNVIMTVLVICFGHENHIDLFQLDLPGVATRGFRNTYELLHLRALKFSPVNKIHIFQCMCMIFLWNFKGTLWNSTQNILPIQWKIRIVYNIEILRALRSKSSYVFLKCPPTLSGRTS